MITRVLDLSEIEVDNAQLEVETFDLQPIVEVCLDLIRPATEAKGLTLTFAVAPGTPATLTADVTRLRQVLLNLLGNAAKFTREGGVELRLRPVDDGMMLRIEVVDSGAGIPADQSIRLFQDFERLDTEATRTAEGAGLGLALSARLVTLMGGRIGHADNPGGGSVFWLELPSNLTVAPAAAAGPPNEQPTARILKVLVVDDVMMNRDIASAFLRTVGHDVTFAEGGAEAIAAVTDTDFDVVLMDVRMPGMDGLQATRHIRALPPPRGQVPIVALTAQAFTEQVAACRAAGMDTHLAKPFDVDALLAAVVHAAALRDREAVQAPMPAPASDEPELMVLDPRVFALTAGVLTPDAVASYMKTLLDLADGLVRTLRDPAASPLTDEALAETAHKLAGSAGMFGFDRLAAICRRFERAMQNADAVQAIASELCITVGLTRQAIVARTRVGVSMPAE
jgi:CheY-like chemotaxis protein